MATPFAKLVREFRGPSWRPDRRAVVPESRDYRMELAWKAYCGDLEPPLKVKPNAPDDNVYFNVSRGVVDKGVSFLFGRGVTWTLDSSQARSDDERYLDEVWRYNNKPVTLHRMATNAGIFGHGFVKIHVQRPYPRLIVLDSSKVTVETADDDYTFVIRFIVRWRGSSVREHGRERFYEYRQIVERVPETTEALGDLSVITPEHWRIVDQRREVSSFDAGVPRDEGVWEEIGREEWNYPFPPIVAFQNLPSPNDYWGISDLEPDAVRLNEAINRVLSNINKIIRLHAHPKTWSRGLTESQIAQIRVDPEGMIHLPGESASLQNLEMRSDLSSSITLYQRLREAHYELTRVPQVSSGTVEDLQYLSAMAMQTLYGPLIEKTETKKGTIGQAIIDINYALLVLAGREGKYCELIWPEILPRDAMVESQTAEIDQRLGFSRDTLITRLGGDPLYEREQRKRDLDEDVERERRLAEARAAGQPAPTGGGGPPSPTANDDRQARIRTARPIP